MLKKRILPLLIAFSLLFTTSAGAQEWLSKSILDRMGENTVAVDGVPGEVVLIVEVEGEPVRPAGARLFSLETQEQNNLQARVQEAVLDTLETPAEVMGVYTSVLNGFSIAVSDASEIEKIEALPGVKSVSVSRTYPLPEVTEGERVYGARLATSAGLIGADKMAELGYRGEGQVIAVLDTELDVDHEFFSHEPTNPKYSRDDIAALLQSAGLHFDLDVDDVYKSAKIPFAYDYVDLSPDVYNDDPDSIHGSHVSGIAAGKGGLGPDGSTPFSGVAPEAQIIFMKVLGGSGTNEYALIQAMDDAAKLGVSAINLSLGIDYAMQSDDPLLRQAVENARNLGIFVSCAAGNASMGYKDEVPLTQNIEYSASGTPAGYSAATSVAGSANSSVWLNQFSLPDGTEVPFVEGSGQKTFASAFSDREYPYIYVGYGTEEDLAALGPDAVKGKIALVRQGGPEGMMSDQKFANAEAAGAIGCMFWYTGSFSYGIAVGASTIPTCIVQNDVGTAMSEITDEGARTLRADPKVTLVPDPKEDRLYLSTSWGTDETLELKPEIMAPAENIYSSVPSEQHNTYASLNGTSMATPHITGAAALLNQWCEEQDAWRADPNHADKVLAPECETPADHTDYIENLMMSTSTIVKQENGVPYSPRRQSAGLLNLENAVKTPVVLVGDDDKTKLSLKDHLEEDFTLTFQAKNTSLATSATYTNATVYTMTDGYETVDGQDYVSGTVALRNTFTGFDGVTVNPGETADISVDISLISAELEANAAHFPNGFYIDGFVELSNEDGSVPPVHIPFMGFYGDWLKAPLYDGTVYGGYAAQGTALLSYIGEDLSLLLGENLFSGEAPSGDKLAFSPNGDGVADELVVGSCLLRGAGALHWDLRDASGAVVASAESEDVYKFYIMPQEFELPESLPDGAYTITGYGYHYYDTQREHRFDFEEALTVQVDTQPPSITGVSVETVDGATLVTVSAADNFALQGIGLLAADGTELSAQSADGTSVSMQFDITGTKPEDITIAVLDYALNEIDVPLAAEDSAAVSGVSTSAFTVTFDSPLELAPENFSLRQGENSVSISSVENRGSGVYRVYADLAYSTAYTLSVDTGSALPLSITFQTPSRSSGGGSSSGSYVPTKPTQEPEPMSKFSDVSASAWYYDAVRYAVEKGLFHGTSDTTFSPSGTMTRAMLVTVLYRAAGAPSIEDEIWGYPFADVDAESWYGTAVYWARLKGITTGTGGETFSPDGSITREQLAVMLYRYAGSPAATGTLSGFTDAAAVGNFAADAMCWAVSEGVVTGKSGGLLDPKGEATRAEVAAILMRYLTSTAD